MSRTITWDLRIDWSMSDTYVDESARLVEARGTVRLAAPESGLASPRGTVDQLTLVLNNADGRYSPLNTSSPLWSLLANGNAYHAPMYLRVSIDGGSNYRRVFTGVIKIPREGAPYPGVAATVEIDCRSRDEILLNQRMSTPLATVRGWQGAGTSVQGIIANILQDAGVSPSDLAMEPGIAPRVPWVWLDDESPIETVWQLAAATGGRFYADQDGYFRFQPLDRWLRTPYDTSQATYDKASYGQMRGPTYDDRELFSGVTVEAAPREVGDNEVLWSSYGTVVVSADSTLTVVAELRQPLYALTEVRHVAVTGGGSIITPDVAIVTTVYAQRVELVITNGHATMAAVLATLEIVGQPLGLPPEDESRITETRTSSDAFWLDFAAVRPGRARRLRGNRFVQTVAQASMLAEFLRDRYEVPRLSWQLANVPGHPNRRPGDRVTVANADVMSTSRDGFVTAVTYRLSHRGFVQDLEIMDATDLFPYGNSGDDGYFVLGTNELGEDTYDVAHLFY